MRMRFFNSRSGRLATAAGIMLGGISLTAVAQIASIPWAATYKSAFEAVGRPRSGVCLGVYTVPKDRKLRITDFSIDHFGEPTALYNQLICSGKAGYCANQRTSYFSAPPYATFTQSLLSGIVFGPGETLYACNFSDRETEWTFHGFLYTTP